MNFKRIIAVTAVAGMLAVTGCSANTPDRNQGNRNGQRVTDAVNRRPDSYTGERTSRGLFGRTTRGVNRATRNTTRNAERTGRAIGDTLGNRYTRTPNRSNTFGRPQGRIGTTFRRGNTRQQARYLDQSVTANETRRNTGIHNTPAIENNTLTMNRTDRGISRGSVNRGVTRGVTRSSGTQNRAGNTGVNTNVNRTNENRVNTQVNTATAQRFAVSNPQPKTMTETRATAPNRATRRAATQNRVTRSGQRNTHGTRRVPNTEARVNNSNQRTQARTQESINRATRRAGNAGRINNASNVTRSNGIGIAPTRNQTVPVASFEHENFAFFNKSKTAPEQPAPVQPAPAQPAPVQPAPIRQMPQPAPSAYEDINNDIDNDYSNDVNNDSRNNTYNNTNTNYDTNPNTNYDTGNQVNPQPTSQPVPNKASPAPTNAKRLMK